MTLQQLTRFFLSSFMRQFSRFIYIGVYLRPFKRVSQGRGVRNSKNLRTPPKNHKKITKNHKKIKKSQKISKNLFKFNMGEIVKIKKSSKKSESLKFWGKNQKIFVHPRTELRTPLHPPFQLINMIRNKCRFLCLFFLVRVRVESTFLEN